MLRIVFITCVIGTLFFSKLGAQQANQFHSWWVYNGNYRIHSHVQLNILYAWSRNEFVKNWQQSLSRVGLTYNLEKSLDLGIGYEWIERYPYGEQPLPSQITIHRFFQQLTLKHKVGKVGIVNVLRFNQEYIQPRFRYFIINQIGVRIPLITSKDRTLLTLAIAQGIFINHGKEVKKNIFGQNRAYGGIQLSLGKASSLDIGYLNQYIIKGNQSIENNHTLYVEFTQKLDFRRR